MSVLHLLWIVPLATTFGYILCGLLVNSNPRTNGDRIRAMSDEELAKYLMQANDCGLSIPFCQNKKECDGLLDNGIIPDEMCMACMMAWLQKEAD
jgi:hypothetical protein